MVLADGAMETDMKSMASYLVVSAAVMLPAVAMAQMSDADYCNALAQRYQTYISNTATGRNPASPSADAQNAIAQCKAGNTVGGIPVLEQKLRDAKVDLPKRG